MEKKKRRSLHNIFAMVFTFAMVLLFAGIGGKKDAFASTYKTINIKLVNASDNTAPVTDAKVVVSIFKRDYNNSNLGYELFDSFTTDDVDESGTCVFSNLGNGVYSFRIDCDTSAQRWVTKGYTGTTDWKYDYNPYMLIVGAEGDHYQATATPSTLTRKDISKADWEKYNNYGRKIGTRMDYLQTDDSEAVTDYTIPLTKLTEEEIFNLKVEAARTKVEEYQKKEVYNLYDTNEQSIIDTTVTTCNSALSLAKNENDINTAVSNAEGILKQLPTLQSKNNDEYAKYIKFEKGNTSIGLEKYSNEKDPYQSYYQIHLRSFHQGGFFKMEGQDSSALQWTAQIEKKSNQLGTYIPVQYILSSGFDKGGFMMMTSLPNDVEYINSNTGREEVDCSVVFGNNKKVTFKLIITKCEIQSIDVTTDSSVELVRNDNLDYTNVIEPTIKVNGSEDDYDYTTTIEALDPKIAYVDDEGKIRPLKDGIAYFEVASADVPSVKKEFSITFTLSSEEKTEKKQALAVYKLIEKVNEVSLESKNDIKAAREAYDKLTDGAKKKVENYSVLVAAERSFKKLQAADVDNKIGAIGEVELTDACENAIKVAKDAYDALDDDVKELVEQDDILNKAVSRWNTLEDYKAKAEIVNNKINEIGEVVLTDECKKAIQEAKEAYDELNEEEQDFVDYNLYELLLEKEDALNTLIVEKQASDDAASVVKLIDSIGDVTLSKEGAIKTARAAYDKLNERARTKVNNYNVLTSAEQKVSALKAEEVKKAEEAAKAEALKKAQEAANTTAAPTVKLSKITLKAKAGKGKVKLTWKKSSKADGYIIYRATKKNGKYKQIKMIKSWKKNSFTDKKVKSKKTYYYKIRAYKGTVNGPVSAAKKAKVK